MKRLLLALGVILGAASMLVAGTVSVDARSDVFEAGLGTPGAVVGANLGFYPVLGVSFTAAPGQTIKFDSITATVNFDVSHPGVGGDGTANPFGNSATSVTSNTGNSGIAF